MKNILDIIKKNKKLLLIVAAILLAFVLYNSVNTKYHKKEIKVLKNQIEQKEEEFKEVIAEKERLQDSSEFYEAAAYKADAAVAQARAKAEKLRKEKEAALAALDHVSKGVVDSFFLFRYKDVPKENVDIVLDKNVGHAAAKELIEKDYLVSEVVLEKDQNKLLSGQVDTLKVSLNFSKSALIKADTALKIRTQQLRISQDLTKLLEQDLKKAKKKAFWNNIKGTAIGVAAGVVVGVLVK